MTALDVEDPEHDDHDHDHHQQQQHQQQSADRFSSSNSKGGLLAQALEVPSLDHHYPSGGLSSSFDTPVSPSVSARSLTPVNGNRFPFPTLEEEEEDDPILPVHSDFTIPTSNASSRQEEPYPPSVLGMPPPSSPEQERRSIFGQTVDQRYAVDYSARQMQQQQQQQEQRQQQQQQQQQLLHGHVTPPQSPMRVRDIHNNPRMGAVSPLTPAYPPPTKIYQKAKDWNLAPPPTTPSGRHKKISESIYAQSLLLGIAFLAVWSPNNIMAPNLTQMAETLGMSEGQRDLYLGSYCALALGVFSLPISGGIGFMADFYSRKYLYVLCLLFGSLSCAWTAWSHSFASLFLARLWNGGFMAASVPVAFSLLGDLFAAEERNAASSGLTAMMGLGIIWGQVYAGTVGPSLGWRHPFYVSAVVTLVTAIFVLIWVKEPQRGAKEKALQDMLQAGNKYDRKLTLDGFVHAMTRNQSNSILLWMGFFTSLPWGIVFVFLNDFLSQEKGFSVPDATFMVMLFGVGCALGGILGGYIGQVCMRHNRSYLPLFMAASTFLGIVPFVGLLNSEFPDHRGYKAMAYSIVGGFIASLPSVNLRPCIINVNPPESRGAALTASNLLITLGRGIGPSCITLMGSIFALDRKTAFQISLTGFWTITAVQLVFLAKCWPKDIDEMEAELANYAAQLSETKDDDEEQHSGIETTLLSPWGPRGSHVIMVDDGSIVSIDEVMTSFDGVAAARSIQFVRKGINEMKDELSKIRYACGSLEEFSSESEEEEDNIVEELSKEEIEKRRQAWEIQKLLSSQDTAAPNDITSEQTPLLNAALVPKYP